MDEAIEREDPAPAEHGGEPELSRRRATTLLIAAVLVASLVVGVVVFAGAGEGSDAEGLERADGTVDAIEPDRVVLRVSEPIDGADQLELAIRPGDRDALDVEHLSYHAAIGDPVSIYYERDGDGYVARRSAELPGFR